ILAICVVLMICAGFIWGLAYDRERDSNRVSREIADEWGKSVTVSGPEILCGDSANSAIRLDSVACEAVINSEVLHRNIFQAEVYKADVVVSGRIGKVETDSLTQSATLHIDLNPRAIISQGEVAVGNSSFPLKRSEDGLTATVPVELLANGTTFAATFKLRGSEEFQFRPSADINSLTLKGNSTSPSFRGTALPVDRTVTDSGYTARWVDIAPEETDEASPYSYSNEVVVYSENYHGVGGVYYVLDVDTYRKVVRAIKYAFLIILLTFTAVFSTEVLSKKTIPLLNYFLIGLALIVFYSLLLSIAELLSFGYAYLISATMTVGLICVYLRTMLHSRRLALYNASFLTILYGCCYMMLCVSTYALLVGSLIIFFALALAMNISLRLQKK
ncbi:MAG: cell envelope integrity protein CreD, partial [Paramuribaculum sp.]|nr:cell envelope integrity protein CreD [Paramuribaculum sp.]